MDFITLRRRFPHVFQTIARYSKPRRSFAEKVCLVFTAHQSKHSQSPPVSVQRLITKHHTNNAMSAHAINESSIGEYRSFLVRLWQSHAGGCWRASAQSIQSGEIIHFTDPTALYAYIEAQLNAGQGQTQPQA